MQLAGDNWKTAALMKPWMDREDEFVAMLVRDMRSSDVGAKRRKVMDTTAARQDSDDDEAEHWSDAGSACHIAGGPTTTETTEVASKRGREDMATTQRESTPRADNATTGAWPAQDFDPVPGGSQRGPCIARLDVCSDRMVVVQLATGFWKVSNPDQLQAAHLCQRLVADLRLQGVRLASEASEFVRRVPRVENACADAMSRGSSDHLEIPDPIKPPPICLRLMIDGSHSARGAGCGWVLMSSEAPADEGPDGITMLARAHRQLPPWLRPVFAELCALMSGPAFVRELLRQNQVGDQVRPPPWSLDPRLLRIAGRPRL